MFRNLDGDVVLSEVRDEMALRSGETLEDADTLGVLGRSAHRDDVAARCELMVRRRTIYSPGKDRRDSVAGMIDEVARLILSQIPNVPYRVSTPELAKELAKAGHDLGARALQKRLAALELEHGLVRHDGSKPHQWSWPKGKKQKLFPTMAPHEALSLLLAREHLHALLPPRTQQWIEERLEQTQREIGDDASGRTRGWVSKVQRVPHELPRIRPRLEARVFKDVSEALFEGLQLELSYRKRFTQAPQSYVVHPLGLCEREGEIWLVARKDESESPDDLRFFLLHRMGQTKVLRGRPLRSIAGFDLRKAIHDGLAHFPLELGSHISLRARFDPRVIEKLLESPLADDQKVTKLPDGWHRLSATVPHTRALHAFLLGYGPLCVVESPKPLREALAKDFEQALAAYRG